MSYTIKLEELCETQPFSADQVVSSELVFPKGAVPNSQLLWVRVELDSGDRKFVTLSLSRFYEYIELPESSIGGWTDGNRGSDYTGLNARYEANNTGSVTEVSGELQHSPEGAEEAVETPVAEPAEDRAAT